MRILLNTITAISLLLFVYGCSSFDYHVPEYEKMADEITEKIAKKLEEEKKLRLVGTGGSMIDDIQMMAMSFDYYQEVDLSTARELLVEVINAYLSAINDNETIRPHLHNYPFTAKNIQIRIWIHPPDQTKLPLNKIFYISALDGILAYYLKVPEHSREALHTETFEKAQQELLIKPIASLRAFPAVL